jgi:hypothetical protein
MIDRLRRLLIKLRPESDPRPPTRRRPQLVVLHGGVGSDSDPCEAWNREWTPREHRGASFTTETAHVDVVNPKHGPRIFIGGSRTFSDRTAIANRISQLPRDTIVLTSRTHGAAAAVRDAVQHLGLQMEVWTARLDWFPTRELAYFARDEEMIRSADRVIAFWDGSTSGTAHELEYARQIGKPMELANARLQVLIGGWGSESAPERPTRPPRLLVLSGGLADRVLRWLPPRSPRGAA